MTLLNSDASVEALGDDLGPSTLLARALPEHVLNSKDDDLDDSDSEYSGFSATQALVDGSIDSDPTSSGKPSNSKATPLHPSVRAPKKSLSKRFHADSNASSANPNASAAVPAKKRVRSNALMRSAPRATSTTTPGGLAGNSEFMYVYSFLLSTYAKTQS